MSFLGGDDTDELLEEVLAFLDECVDDKKAPKGKKLTRSSGLTTRTSAQSSKTQKTLCYTGQLQRRKKAELQALREEALALELQVGLLKQCRERRKAEKTHMDGDDSQLWFKRAVKEFHRRQKAERKNRKLKEVWQNQQKVNGAFRHLVQRRSLLYGKKYVFEDEDETSKKTLEMSVEDETMTIISQLEKSVERLYIASDSVFPPDLPATISCNTRVKRTDESQGNCIEVVTTTPVSCPLRVAADVLWKDLNVMDLTSKGQDPERIYRFIHRRKPNSLDKNYLVALQVPSGVLQIDGLQFMRKYEEPDRVVMIKSNTLKLSSTNLRFQDHCWIIISRSKTDPANAAVVHTCCRFFAESLGTALTPQNIIHTRDYILSTLSGKILRDHQMLQNLVIQETRRAGSGGNFVWV